MVSEQSKDVSARAKALYAQKLRQDLESNHPNQFVAIEPDSGDYFLADSFGQAVALARAKHAERISFVIRIGHAAAIHLGGIAT